MNAAAAARSGLERLIEHVKPLPDADRPPPREVAALHRFEIFLFTGIATVLVVRSFLAVTGYPKVGGHGLHIAHVLWGGLFMAVAVVFGLAGLGSRIRTWAAFLGGIGFGLFIDEIGKFLTTSVNYFYTPAVAIMYLVFVAFYLTVREILLHRKMTDRRRIALVTAALGDQALGQLDERNRQHALRLLDGVQRPAASTVALRAALLEQPITERPFQEWLNLRQAQTVAVLHRIVTNPLVQLAVFGLLVYEVAHRLHEHIGYLQLTIDLERLVNEVNAILADQEAGRVGLHFSFYFWYLMVSNLVCLTIAAVGLLLTVPPWTRRWGLRLLAWALLLDILFNQFSAFDYSQFRALFGFGCELVILLGIRELLRSGQVPDFDHRLWRRVRRATA